MKCPKCNEHISEVIGKEVKISMGKATWRGVSYACESCETILSIQADPMSLKADIISELTRQIQTWTSR
jgi:hypothetical protein